MTKQFLQAIEKKRIERLESLCPGAKDLLLNIQKIRQMPQIFQLACCGDYNAGKSTLLNALSGNVNREYFATGDIRVTDKIQTLENQNLCFIDTPGLAFSERDQQLANQAASQADGLLFVHRLQQGELAKNELQWLAATFKQRPELAKNSLLVLTASESATASQLKKIEQKIGENIHRLRLKNDQGESKIFENMPIIAVSARSWIKGKSEGKKLLQKSSNIQQIIDWIADKKGSQEQLRQQELNRQQHELKQKLATQSDELHHISARYRFTKQRAMQGLTQDLQQLKQEIEPLVNNALAR